VHCKKRNYEIPGLLLIKPSRDWELSNYSRPGRVWKVTSRLGMGISLTFFFLQFSISLRTEFGVYRIAISNRFLVLDRLSYFRSTDRRLNNNRQDRPEQNLPTLPTF